MKQLVWRLVFPLSFVSFFLFDKWWYVEILDGPDIVQHGFPLISNSPSFASSMEMNYYVLETIINVLIYFLFCYIMVYLVNRFIAPIPVSNIFAKITTILFAIFIIAFIYFSIEFNTTFYLKNDLEIDHTMDTGYEWIWKHTQRPDYYKYHPKLKD